MPAYSRHNEDNQINCTNKSSKYNNLSNMKSCDNLLNTTVQVQIGQEQNNQ